MRAQQEDRIGKEHKPNLEGFEQGPGKGCKIPRELRSRLILHQPVTRLRMSSTTSWPGMKLVRGQGPAQPIANYPRGKPCPPAPSSTVIPGPPNPPAPRS